MLKLSVVIVNYNAGDFLSDSLKSLYEVKDEVDLSVWVVDNGSSDGSLQKAKECFAGTHYIENKKNLGFGAANNQALKEINSEYILLLNPDTRIKKGILSFMVEFMKKNPTVGAATCKSIKSDGTIDWACHRGFPTPWASILYFLGSDKLYHLTGCDMRKAHEIDSLSGSFFLTRKSVLDKVGLFDEDYWLYGEDIDLCYRIKKAGFKIMYVPEVTVTHLKGVSSGIKKHSQDISTADNKSKNSAFNSFYETMKIFYNKNLASGYPFFINWLVILGINLRWAWAKRKMTV